MAELKIQHFGLTDIGNVRKANEDSLGALESSYGPIFTVCDGMGGHAGGAMASSIAVRVILEQISKSTIDNASVAINNALISANQAILNAAAANSELKGMGTTSTVLVVQPDGIYIGYIGDSRIYIFSNKELCRLTRDDSFVQGLVDRGTITEQEADSHPRKNELIKALGVSELVQPTVIDKPIRPKKGDILLLCTDGLCGLVNDVKMQDILSDNPRDIKAAARQLINVAKAAGGTDNITVQLIRVIESPYNRSEFQVYANGVFQSNKIVENASDTQTIKKNSEKKEPITIRVKPVLLAAALFVSVIAFTRIVGIWPFSNFTPIITNNTDAAEKRGDDGLFKGDELEHGWLVHTLTNNDKRLERLTTSRSKVNEEPYTDFNFDITYSMDDRTLNDETFRKEKKIKWKRIEKVDSIIHHGADTIIHHEIVIPADTAKKHPHVNVNPKRPKKEDKPADGQVEPVPGIDDLKKQHAKCEQELAGYKSKLEEAEANLKNADSLQLANSDKSQNEKLSKNFNKAKEQRDKLKADKEKCEADCKRIQKQIEESGKT